jgi:hypothetical protein
MLAGSIGGIKFFGCVEDLITAHHRSLASQDVALFFDRRAVRGVIRRLNLCVLSGSSAFDRDRCDVQSIHFLRMKPSSLPALWLVSNISICSVRLDLRRQSLSTCSRTIKDISGVILKVRACGSCWTCSSKHVDTIFKKCAGPCLRKSVLAFLEIPL